MSTKKMRRAGGCAVGWDVPGQGALVVPGSPRLKDGPPLSRLLLPNPSILSRAHPLDCLDVRAGLVEPGGHAVLRFMWWEPTRSTGRRASPRAGASYPFARHQQIGRALDRSTLDAQRSTLNGRRSTLNGRRSTLNGRRSTVDAQRSTVDARRSTVDARCTTKAVVGRCELGVSR